MWQLGTLVGAPVGIALLAGTLEITFQRQLYVFVHPCYFARYIHSCHVDRDSSVGGTQVARPLQKRRSVQEKRCHHWRSRSFRKY